MRIARFQACDVHIFRVSKARRGSSSSQPFAALPGRRQILELARNLAT